MKKMNFHLLIFTIIISFCCFQSKAQTVTDTIGNTIVEISVAVDTNHFTGGYFSGPWDIFWGPDQKLWYTNETRLCTYDPATHIVDTILQIDSGFIMSVATHHDFQNNPFVYLAIDSAYYYAAGNNIQVYKYDYSLTGDSLYNPQFILDWYHGGEHSGGRILFGDDNKLYVATAEYFSQFDTLFNNSGKVLRVNPDGSVPIDNPRADYTFTYGHRNPQGIVQTPNGNLIVSEYGMQYDEVNLLEAGRFYGWWIYDGDSCFNNSDSCDYYDSIAVFPIDVGRNPASGIDFYNNAAIPEFNGLIQAVTGFNQGLIAYTMNATYDSVLVKTFYLTSEYGRVRDVCAAPDGSVYFIAHDRNRADIHVIRNPLFNNIKNESNLDFSIFPNPANENLNIINFKANKNSSISIFNSIGKIVYQDDNFNGESIDVGRFPDGVYFVKCFADEMIEVERVVICH
ncbi:MAG: PQQ-dependent sugar dehydrogenase [Bacteroidetes bacterium]|nr:PQQ-dependent sugar dehydrogenase [Bacteroidota bacterium]